MFERRCFSSFVREETKKREGEGRMVVTESPHVAVLSC